MRKRSNVRAERPSQLDYPDTAVVLETLHTRHRALLNSAQRMALVEHTALAPFLDLFVRMTDAQLAKLTDVPTSTVAAQRKTVDRIMGQLEPFEDLLPRLEDDALARLIAQDLEDAGWVSARPRSPAGSPPPPGP